MHVLRELRSNWRDLSIHESSPVGRGASVIISQECAKYIKTQFYPDIQRGAYKDGYRCEDLERQTLEDSTFDVVISQDVMEHIFDPAQAYAEIYRTLRSGGIYIHTTPIYKDRVTTEQRARLLSNGSIEYLAKPEYHSNPIDPSGSLVTYHYGYDLADLISEWTPFDVEIRRFHDRTSGIVAEFSEVIVCHKRSLKSYK